MSEFINLYNKNGLDFFKKFEVFFKEKKEGFVLEEILPIHYKAKYIDKKEELLTESLTLDRDFNYYDVFNRQTKLFNSLEATKIDGLLLLAYKEIEKNETVSSTLNSFNPKRGYAKKTVYNRTDTVTGRLTVKTGPKILTIPSRCRNIISSRFEDGSILYVDFKSLEPRIISYMSGNDFCNDIYEEIHSQLSFHTDRSVIKRAVISLTYGSSIRNIDNMSQDKTKEISDVINNYFDFKKLISLAKKINEDGYRRNFFGRPILNTEETNERKILNNFIQSTAVDIALNYFSCLIEEINIEKALPLFIIHDAIVFDVSSEYEEKFKKVISKNCINKIGIFPLEITEEKRRKD